jgi:hypothetical protein
VSADAAAPRYTFPKPTALPLEAAFDGGRLTSEGGPPRLAAAEAAHGLCAAFARTGRRRAAPTTATTASTCSTRCWSSTARRAN